MRTMKMRIVLVMTLFSIAIRAGTITINLLPSITGPSGGLFSYSYSVTNNISSSENLFSFALGEAGPLISIVSPPGWTFDDLSSPGFIIWTSQDQSFDLTPGSTDFFGFSSSLPAGTQQFLGFGSDPIFGFPTGDLDQGSTVGPTVSSVPEPSASGLVLTGLLLVVFLTGRRKVRTS